MSANQNSKLLPCPFCGGEAYTVNDGGSYWTVECHDCAAHTGLYGTKDFAITAWNARAERTCECVEEYAESPLDGKTIVLHRCSACHELMRPHMRYCPNCGCKVVGA